jgi:hypothetical protein
MLPNPKIEPPSHSGCGISYKSLWRNIRVFPYRKTDICLGEKGGTACNRGSLPEPAEGVDGVANNGSIRFCVSNLLSIEERRGQMGVSLCRTSQL